MLGLGMTYLLQVIFGGDFYYRLMLMPVNTTMSFQELLEGEISAHTGPDFITLFTHAFLHDSILHLLGNVFFLWFFGAIANELIGGKWVIFTFVVTAFFGGVLHVAMAPQEAIPMLGASGAASGFAGLYLGMAFRWQLPDPHIWPISRPIPPTHLVLLALFGLFMDLIGNATAMDNIAYGAHLGGFVAGMLIGGAVVPMPRVALPR